MSNQTPEERAKMLAKRDKAKIGRSARKAVRQVTDDTKVPKEGHPLYRKLGQRPGRPDGAAVSTASAPLLRRSRLLLAAYAARESRLWPGPEAGTAYLAALQIERQAAAQ
jgi:hypothetical protein